MIHHPTVKVPAEDGSSRFVHTLHSTWDHILLFLHKVRPHLIPALVILAASTCVLFWFRGFLLYYWDGFFPFNPSAVFRSFVWPWSDLISTGVPYTTSMGLPYIAFVYTLHDLFGLSLVVTEVVIYYLLLAAGGLGMYWFFISQANARISGFWQVRFGGLAAALIYMFNPYWMVYVWQIFSLEAFLYATLPFLLLLFQRGVAQAANRQSTWGTVTAIALVTVFASPALGNPALSIPLAVGFGVLFLLKLIPLGNLSKRLASMRFLLTAAVSIIAVNMWWLYPVSVLSKDHLIRAGGTSYGIEGLNDLVFNSAHTEYFNLLRLAGIVSFYRPPVYPHYDFAWM